MSENQDALRKIKAMFNTIVPRTGREKRILAIACAALNLADEEDEMLATIEEEMQRKYGMENEMREARKYPIEEVEKDNDNS